jgi:hypothetical protein
MSIHTPLVINHLDRLIDSGMIQKGAEIWLFSHQFREYTQYFASCHAVLYRQETVKPFQYRGHPLRSTKTVAA